MTLIVIVCMLAGSKDGGAAVRVVDLGNFTPAACVAVAERISAGATFDFWKRDVPFKGGYVVTKAFCVSRT